MSVGKMFVGKMSWKRLLRLKFDDKFYLLKDGLSTYVDQPK